MPAGAVSLDTVRGVVAAEVCCDLWRERESPMRRFRPREIMEAVRGDDRCSAVLRYCMPRTSVRAGRRRVHRTGFDPGGLQWQQCSRGRATIQFLVGDRGSLLISKC